MTKNSYWIADVEGVKAVVEGADQRDYWVRVNGWTETTEPTGLEMQWVRNEAHSGKGVMNAQAAKLHEGLGWFPTSPPDPYATTDDQAAAPVPSAPTSEPPAASTKSGAGEKAAKDASS